MTKGKGIKKVDDTQSKKVDTSKPGSYFREAEGKDWRQTAKPARQLTATEKAKVRKQLISDANSKSETEGV